MQERKELGKIQKVSFGIGGYQDSMFGITFTLGGEGWGVCDSWGTWAPGLVDPDPHCKWTDTERREKLADIATRISKLLLTAKKTDVMQLANVPVEITFEGTTLKSWRVLTEVL